MSNHEFVFTYYDSPGLAEPARMILAYSGADWKDNRIPLNVGGPNPIPDDIKPRLRFGQVPLLEFGDKKLVQSVAICRFLGKRFNLAGKDAFEAAQCDEITDCVRDIAALFRPAFHEKDEEKKATILKEAVVNSKTKFLPRLEEIVNANGGYTVGKGLTWADIVLARGLQSLGEHLQAVGENITADYPGLQKLVEKVSNAPGIKEHIAKHAKHTH